MYLHVFIVICSALLRVCSIKSFGFLVNSQYQVPSDKCSNRTTTYTDFLLLMSLCHCVTLFCTFSEDPASKM